MHKIPRRPAVPRPICRPAPAAGRNVYPAAALWRTGPHVCGAQCAPLQGARGFGAERAKCRDRSGEHCSPWPFDGRGAHRSGRNVCPAAALRRTGPHFCGAQCAPLQDRGSWRRAGAAAGPYSCHTSGLRMDTTVPDCRGLSVVSTSFAAHGSAFLWRTMCAATGGTGVGAGRTKCRDRSGEHCSPWPFVRRGAYRPGRNVCPAAVLRRTGPHVCGAHCAPLQGARGLAQGVQNAETVAANIVRHGRSSGEGRTGPAGTCPRRGFAANGSAFCGARCAPLQGVRGWRRSAALRRTGPRFCGARCAPLQGTAGFGAGVRGITANRSAFCGARCAPLQVARVSAQGVQNAETVAANIVRHGRSMGEGRTGPAGTCAPLRLCGERVRIL